MLWQIVAMGVPDLKQKTFTLAAEYEAAVLQSAALPLDGTRPVVALGAVVTRQGET